MILGHGYDGRIDIWSVGAVLAELYTDYVLFQNESVQTMLARIGNDSIAQRCLTCGMANSVPLSLRLS